jgi:radical SAM/Cys-rich protein
MSETFALEVLQSPLPDPGVGFEERLSSERAGSGEHARAVATGLRRNVTSTLQINLGKLCNQACHHCHVEAGPKRTEAMTEETAQRVIRLLEASPSIRTVDFTGGAPELNPHFRWMVSRCRELDREVIDRCNLSILFEPGMEDLGEFLAQQHARVVASLPCYLQDNVDGQRGKGVFDKSIEGLRLLNDLGYGTAGSGLGLDLVYNPTGISLPPPQATLEADYKRELRDRFDIEFNALLTITNMPIKRFRDALARKGELDAYMALLTTNFNSATVPGLMCRTLVSVGWDGNLYDCDFNQMLEIEAGATHARTLWDIEHYGELDGSRVATDAHCFGCTAGSGSSCGGALQ